MRYCEAIQGGKALEITPSEFMLTSRSLAVGLATRAPEGTYRFDSTDKHFVGLALEGVGVPDITSPSEDDIARAAKGLSGLLSDASVLKLGRRLNEAVVRLHDIGKTIEHRELFDEMDVIAHTAESAQRLNIDPIALDLAKCDALVLTPPVATIAVGGMRRIARSHNFTVAVRDTYNLARFVLGSYPDAKPMPLPREPASLRKSAKAALKSLDSAQK